MLILSRFAGESIYVGDAKIVVLSCERGKVKLGIDAPLEVPVHREEVRERINNTNVASMWRDDALEGGSGS